MAKTICLFNNKGGVGKTTFLFHVSHRLAELGHTTLMVDCDSQCNLTAYALSDAAILRSWEDGGNSIYRQVEPVDRTIGDIRDRAPTKLNENLWILPGHLDLSKFEDRLGDTWNGAKGGSEPALRAQAAIYRVIAQAAVKCSARIVLIDLGPNLGAINRAVLSGTDLVVVPIAPDLFSIRGSENLGSKLVTWRKDWDQCNSAWGDSSLPIPSGRPRFLGYVLQQHNLRNNAAGMTQGWQIFGQEVPLAIQRNIVDKLAPLDQVEDRSRTSFELGKIPNLHSLIPYSLEARKPVFQCTGSDGLKGAHIARARESRDLFDPIAQLLIDIS
jgi:cellulose biosynthesis protein BcsQ